MQSWMRKYKWPLILVGGVVLGSSVFASPETSSVSPVQDQIYQVQTKQPLPVVSQPSQSKQLSNDNYYTNVDGNEVHSPAYSDSVPAGASAQCRDGTYSFSQHRSGTCSHHGGVADWL
jgi:hypothetical protein